MRVEESRGEQEVTKETREKRREREMKHDERRKEEWMKGK